MYISGGDMRFPNVKQALGAPKQAQLRIWKFVTQVVATVSNAASATDRARRTSTFTSGQT